MLGPLIIGHRGASAVAPENTIAAFQAAIAAGADGIEFDVRLARDNVSVVIHDDTLYRTHRVRQRVADSSAAQLNEFDVPSLAHVFELFASNKFLLYLEMKSKETQLAEECCRLVEEYRLKDRVIFECFEHSALQTIKNIDSTFRTAALFQPPASFIVKRALGIEANEIALHHRLTNKRTIERARHADLNVVTWTVDDPVWVKRAQEFDIHALITNDPATLIAARNTI